MVPVTHMDYGELLGDAWGYTKECTLKNPLRWMKMIVAVLCLGLPFNGYVLQVYRGANPAPEVDNWGTLFVDGLKMLAIAFVYLLPLILSMALLLAVTIAAVILDVADTYGIFFGILNRLFELLMYILEFVALVILPIATIRFARSGIFSEAFNFPGIAATIGKIGWLNYLVAVVLVSLLVGIPICMILFVLIVVVIFTYVIFSSNVFALLGIIAVMAIIIVISLPLISIFQARYLARVYESAGECTGDSLQVTP